MQKCVFIVFLLLFASITKGQQVKTYTKKEFQYKAYYTADSGYCFVDSIVILKVLDKKRIQKIIVPENEISCGTDYDPLVIEDYNFDNHDDFSVIQFQPAAPNIPHYYWLYDTIKKKHVRNTTLEQITSLEVDKKNSCLVSYFRGNAVSFWTSTYKWIKNKLTCIQEIEQEYKGGVDNEPSYFIETTRKLVNGKMKIISKERKKSEEYP